MSWLLSILVGVLSGAVACVAAGLIAGLLVVDWYRITSFEGTSGYFVVFVGLFGGVVGFLVGVVCARVVAGGPAPTFVQALLLSTKTLLAVFATGTLFAWLNAPPARTAPVAVTPSVVTPPEPAPPAAPDLFDALTDDAPLRAWLPYTRYGTPPMRRERALAVLRARPELARELAPLLHAADSTVQSDALRLLEPIPLAQSSADVAEAGRELAAKIVAFNGTPPADDPRFELAADIYVRFSAWIIAVRALRAEAAGDFRSELRAIAKAARVRPDSRALRQDVLPIAEHYLSEWGADPDASD